MRKLWRLIFRGCWRCDWEVIDERRLERATGSTGNRYYLRCKTCGWIVKRDLA